MARNQAGSSSIALNEVNTSKTSGGENTVAIARGTSGGGNTITIEFNIKNEGAGKSKRGIDSVIRN